MLVSVVLESPKEFMRSIDHVEEAIIISLLLIDLAHGSGHTGKALVVHQQVKCLCVRQSHSVPVKRCASYGTIIEY